MYKVILKNSSQTAEIGGKEKKPKCWEDHFRLLQRMNICPMESLAETFRTSVD